MIEKACTNCGRILSSGIDGEFYIKASGSENSHCKSCAKEIVKIWRKSSEGRKTRAFYYAREREKNHADPTITLWWNARYRSRKKNLEFTITREDIVVPPMCPVLGIPLIVSDVSATANSPSIDRRDQNKGYTPDNIRIISWRANRLKSDASIEEIEKVLQYMKNG